MRPTTFFPASLGSMESWLLPFAIQIVSEL